MKTILFCSFLLFVVVGCKKGISNKGNQNGNDIFPNEVGDTWTYLVNDTILNPTIVSQYNMTVSIIDSITLTGGIKAKVWVYSYPSRTDTFYVFKNSDTINFTSNKRFYLELVGRYITPLRLGNSWKYSWLSVHDVIVDSIAAIVVGQNQFENAFHISGSPGKPDEIITIDEWLVDYVGIVRKYTNGSGTTNPYKYRTLWSLVSYHLE